MGERPWVSPRADGCICEGWRQPGFRVEQMLLCPVCGAALGSDLHSRRLHCHFHGGPEPTEVVR